MRRAGAIVCGLLLLAGGAGLWVWSHPGAAEPASAETPASWHHGPLWGVGPFPEPEPPATPPAAIDQVRLALAQAYYQHVSVATLTRPSIPLILGALGDPYTEYLAPGRVRSPAGAPEPEVLRSRPDGRPRRQGTSGDGIACGAGPGSRNPPRGHHRRHRRDPGERCSLRPVARAHQGRAGDDRGARGEKAG